MTPRIQTSTPETRHTGAGLRPESEQVAPRPGAPETEVRTMQLSELIDLRTQAQQVGETIPCRDYDAELWFAERPDDVEFAKTLCGLCPARTQCLAGALERQEPWGVWGGQLLVQGVVVPRKRPRGRPRKHPVAA
ncbi:WhiB family redox-sensing transcriptional regulator [Terracoccus luteus]|jgi:WhiB family redox-sensing transcriptional regulator|uniref:Transcriptional regulator WhiB n=2 Tax=Terracoccus luteus TaxID=53356 RepID=A0A495Y346_9MICO|nr:WhiB family transcriptional regulator [Terracoccus luteus]MBB2985835.1 WhiB family redox-sensing transcriptional regulator [Terracoccus luteus]MCP2171487.1 WhiB family redox-sensing transcriptional regulator [Terracoccus luteus]RKT78588.1 WhiB family redox-sensing transcriptional regulator [Terracoccus luteus]